MTKLEKDMLIVIGRHKSTAALKGSTWQDVNVAHAKAAAEVAKRYIENYKALIDAQSAYIKFLSDYTASITPYLTVHRMGPSQDEVEKGVQLRIQIAAKEEVIKQNGVTE